MRSLLFVPGDSLRKIEKALASAADVILLDLEDSVAADSKPAARAIVAEIIKGVSPQTRERLYVRVNDFASGLIQQDIDAILASRPAGIMLPKTVGSVDVERLSVSLRAAEVLAGTEDGATRILPIITETPAGLFAAGSFTRSHPRLSGLTWGAEDLSAAIGARSTRDPAGRYTDVFRLARATTLLAASAAEVAAIDTVFVDFRDAAGLRAECLDAERDGFTGKMAIHPDQVEVINAVFTPSAETVEEARAIVAAFAAAGYPGVLGIGGRMYDRPHLRRAERLIARAVRTL
ncbi:MAG: CoA ester lyase [Rhizobiaceae bacterium]|nr:CoA ester lyase [Rhizobiaceae bacterium]